MLLCNYRKCRQPLRLCAIGTVCRHVFCRDHNPVNAKTAEGVVYCPACRTRLKENFEIMEIDLQPCEQFKNMILMGLNPETIFDICKRAIDFYMFQKTQELKYYEYLNYKMNEKGKNLEAHCKTVISSLEEKNISLQAEKEALIKECEELRDNLVASSQKLTQLESELNRLSLSRISTHEQPKDSPNVSRDRFIMRSRMASMSDETARSKIPRCSPDSTYASPAAFGVYNNFLPFNLRKRLESVQAEKNHRPGGIKSPVLPRISEQSVSDSFRNISRASTKTFFH
ncbi:Cyclin B1 interacting protein 1 [Fasciola hepatica]|uniref:Cyclin B1 interacting protein 1 n=1 Tax=Fasciola hepatica TaxID=6192 RepID=A0A4E0QV35_FASHE|nr:Cyclin B1 interacting protein 1 [Fasciola hepatica]